MTPENRELLFKDLCGRVPYEVIVCIDGTTNAKLASVSYWEEVELQDGSRCLYDISDIKPYLFPLSSMTEEQEEEYGKCYDIDLANSTKNLYDRLDGKKVINGYPMYNHIDWFNRNHFDYRGLISMGLANDATGLNIY